MIRLFLAIVLFAALASTLWAGGVAGTWQLVLTPEDGDETEWTLVLRDEGGKLSGTLSGEPGDFPIRDVRFEDGVLTFKVTIDEETVAHEARVTGSTLSGSYAGRSGKGAIKGTRQS